ncbi:MAG TPA: hypothetical protein VJ485_00980 [archaeon]|nr:hypothetical protein [archaeon]
MISGKKVTEVAFKLTMRKKGFLDISLRTIVLIIFAVAFLALAILWVSRFFGNMPF